MKFLSELGFLTGARTKIGAWLLIIGVVVEGLLQVLPGLTGVIGWAGPLLHALTPVGAALAALGIRYKGTSPTP